jgi:hypothetical protein
LCATRPWEDKNGWPAKRDFGTFRKWFEVTGESMVVDLGHSELQAEEL